MTTALEDWGNQQRTDGADNAGHEHVVDEIEITGAHERDERATHEDDDATAADDAVDDRTAADAEVLAKKKKQGTQIIMAAGGLCVALVIGVVGVGIMKRNADQQVQHVEVAQHAPEQYPAGQSSDLQVAPVGVSASATAPAIIMERAEGSAAIAPAGGQAQVAPPTPDFGLQTAVGAPAPVVSTAPSTPVIVAPTAVGQAPAPVPVQSAGSQKTQQALALTGAPKTDVAAGELDKLRADVAALRADLAEKTTTVDSVRGEISGLRAQLSSRPAAPKPAVAKVAPKLAPEVSKPAATPAVVVVTETVQPNNSPSATPAAATAKGKVRSDFRIYAAVDGRFWVVGPDNEPVQVAVRSPLSDGTRVTSIDVEKNVIFTTTGEIR